jgi:hypothetical protein
MPQTAAPPNDTEAGQRIEADVRVLADDAMEGRETGTPGYDKAADYVAKRFAEIGLAPAGDDGSFFQRVPLLKATLRQEGARFEVRRGGKTIALAFKQEFLHGANYHAPEAFVEAPAVFVGQGVHAPGLDHDDFAGLASSDWLAIVGVDQETRVRLRLARDGERVRYILSSDDRLNRWSEGLPETGDGTVPVAGAEPSFLDRSELVCLSPDDLGYWEIGDRVLVRPAGWHALLPKCNVAQRLITKHLKGAKGDDSVWGRPAPGVAERSWRPPIPGLRPKR